MLKLYYAPGASSMSCHIALEEIGIDYESQAISFATNEQRSPEYLKVNPHGRVPALVTDGGILLENTAILYYLSATYAPQLMPSDPLQRAYAIALMAWFSNHVHPAFRHVMRPERYATDRKVFDHLKAVGRDNFLDALEEINAIVGKKKLAQWILGDQFTVVDAYALVFYGWGKRIDLPMGDLNRYTAWKDRML